MTNKSTSTKISLFIAFVLVSAIFSVNGNVYAQQNVTLSEASNVTGTAEQNFTNGTSSVPAEEELLPTTTTTTTNTTDGLVTDNATSATPRDEVVEQTDEQHNETSTNKTSTNTVTRDSQTVLLEGDSLPEDSFIHLYDSTPYKIMNGHIAAKLPCSEDSATAVNVLIGQAPNLAPAELEFVEPLSTPGDLCLYHVDIASNETTPITDIAIQNNSTEDIDFPATSTIVLGVNEIAHLSGEHHE